MNKLGYLSAFLQRAAEDDRILGSHICLFVSLCQMWCKQDQVNPIHISRKELMRQSKIASTSTYHRCMADLNNFGYVSYHPSYHPKQGSKVYFNPEPTCLPRYGSGRLP